ncbi:DivIVA family protein [Beutenbergia cavernae DSM 12333]|uniref:Cell wall synthesis protein Wag31 n=1 Tax=Beutenbergia cavernae (strain ATCC BAA-8 / DSM 12333 / CCUG 43141 / JCM 11478 / NBRC 16432 / NCIMB 13614 / HKI 0122) TaxID=471853 RepID=C5BW52_BEUC1|nr:DivIVA domain-containing protein [Beutenbergia cavernae]ACQ80653.1 DivIVA family protein [Beutenbergia cavernae DSM 12333]
MALLTADDVLNKKFQTTKFREGYDQDEVDDFLDEIVNTLRVTAGENEELKTKLAAAERRVSELSRSGGGAAAAAPAVDETGPVTQVTAPVAPEPEPEPPAPKPTPAPAPAYAQPAAPAAPAPRPGQTEPESATGMLQLAQRLHDEYVRNGKEEADRIVAEARSAGDQIQQEAQEQRSRTLKQLETERATLEHKISQLRAFERDYRTRLKGYLGGLLENLDKQASIIGLDSAADVPTLP